MIAGQQSLYAQSTCFDHWFAAAMRPLARRLRALGQRPWAVLFLGLAALCALWGAWLTYDLALTIAVGGVAWQATAAEAGAVLLAGAAARHFLVVGQAILPAARQRTRVHTWGLLGLMPATVLVPVALGVAYAVQPGLALVLLAALAAVLAGVVMAVRTRVTPAAPAAPAAPPEPVIVLRALAPRPAAVVEKEPAAPAAAVDRSVLLAVLREAGIPVNIARALYKGGVRSVAQLDQASDAVLLAIPGVGPATVRRLRAHFARAA